MRRTIDSPVASFLKLRSPLLSLSIRGLKKLWLLLTVSRLFHVDHVVQNRRGALLLAWHEWFSLKSKEWKIYCCGLVLSSEPQIGSLRSTARQCHKFCIFDERRQNLCRSFTCCYYFCSFLFHSRQICVMKLIMSISQVIKNTQERIWIFFPNLDTEPLNSVSE